MSEENIQKEIVDKFKQETKWFYSSIEKFLTRNKIDLNNITTINKALEEVEKEIRNIETIISKPIGQEIDTSGHTIYLFKNLTKDDGRQLTIKRDDLRGDIFYLGLLLSITKFFNSNDKTQRGINKKTNTIQRKRNTKKKENFLIDSFIENSFKYYLGLQKDFAKYSGISEGTVSRYFKKLNFINKLFDEMNDKYENLNKTHYEENKEDYDTFTLNFGYIKKRKEDLETNHKFDAAKKELPRLREKEKSLQIRDKS